MLHGSFLLFNSANLSHAGPPVQQPRQFLQLIHSADRINVYPAIVFIANPAADTDPARILLDEPAEPDALHASRHKPSPSLNFQWAGSFWRAGLDSLIAASIARSKCLMVKGFGIRRNPWSRT